MEDVKNVIFEAIQRQNKIVCVYEGSKKIVEPYHLGVLGKKDQLHCYRVDGAPYYQGWKNLILSKIDSVSLYLNATFPLREDYNKKGARYSEIHISINDYLENYINLTP